MSTALMIYLAGVGLGLWRTDGPPLIRVGLALLWPVGPVAFALTLLLLLGASLIAFPLFGAIVVLMAAIAWLIMR